MMMSTERSADYAKLVLVSDGGDTGDLPPSNTRRWVPRRKAAVVNAVREGRITLEQVCQRYELSEEEFGSWERLIEQHGLKGLRTTRTQEFRKPTLESEDE
jgi:transposase-like protein